MVVLLAYSITLGLSGPIVTRLISSSRPSGELIEAPEEPAHTTEERRRLGNVIGKCENIIVVTLILAGAETGLALIFTAKTLVRRQDIEQDPGYFLGGTLLNFVWSLIVAMLARVLIRGF